MSKGVVREPEALIGESPDRLSLPERERYGRWWLALEIYTPRTLPLRVIEALAPTAEECLKQIAQRGLNPAEFELVRLADR